MRVSIKLCFQRSRARNECVRVESLVFAVSCTHFLASMTFFLFLSIHAGSSSRPSEFCAIDQYSISSDGNYRFGLGVCQHALYSWSWLSSESVEVVNRPVVIRQPTIADSVVEQTSRRNHSSSSRSRVVYYWSWTFVWRNDTKDGNISRISDSFQSLQEVQLVFVYFRNRVHTNLSGD